jgi:hypothetical protein
MENCVQLLTIVRFLLNVVQPLEACKEFLEINR